MSFSRPCAALIEDSKHKWSGLEWLASNLIRAVVDSNIALSMSYILVRAAGRDGCIMDTSLYIQLTAAEGHREGLSIGEWIGGAHLGRWSQTTPLIPPSHTSNILYPPSPFHKSLPYSIQSWGSWGFSMLPIHMLLLIVYHPIYQYDLKCPIILPLVSKCQPIFLVRNATAAISSLDAHIFGQPISDKEDNFGCRPKSDDDHGNLL